MEEEELDYEGPEFNEDPHGHSPNSLSEDVELMVSCFSNINSETSSTPANLNERSQEAASELHNPIGLSSNCSSHQTFENLLPSTPGPSTSVADPEDFRLDGQTQTVRIDPSFLFPPAVHSPDSTSVEASSSVFVAGVGTGVYHHLREIHSSTSPRGILKIKEKHGSYCKSVDKCLSILSTASCSSDGLYQTAKMVFKNSCFGQFFEGECSKDICLKDHHHLPDLNSWDSYTVWLVSQYVIFKSPKPRIEIMKILVQYFSFNYDSSKTLAMAKCICKLSRPENIEFANFLVKSLNCSTEKIAVMWVLFITFSDLESDEFNALMEGLGVFKEDSTFYLDLFNFLDFRAHALPFENLVKLIDDIVICHSPLKTDDFLGVVVGFFGRLPENDKERMEPVLTRLKSKFGISSIELRLAPSANLETGEVPHAPHSGSPKHCLSVKKRVTFAEDSNCVGMSDPDSEAHQVIDSASDENSEIVHAVFKNLCVDWILNGVCRKPTCYETHFFNPRALKDVPIENIVAAAEFFIEKSVRPNIAVLRGFVDVLGRSNELSTLLSFRKCAPKLSASDSSRLTVLIMSRLAEHVDHWSAIEMVLTPNLLDICNKHEDLFLFDSNLLKTVMSDAIMKKSSLLRCVSDEILRRVSILPQEEKVINMETTITFFRKFILNQRKILCCPDLHPTEVTGKFSSQFKTELHKGSKNGYYVVSLMLKFAAERGDSEIEEALDILYSFLLIQFSRARIIRDILKRCIAQPSPTRKSILRLLGNASLCVILRLVEDGNLAQAAKTFRVLRKFRVNLFDLEHKFSEVSNVELALIFCSLTVECGKQNDAIELFLNECLPRFLGTSPSMPILNRIHALTEKMFRKFNKESLWHESISLFNGISSRQQSLLYPLNISKFYETTLRVCQSSPNKSEARQACLKLFLAMEDSGECFDLQTVTYRSLLLTAVKEKIISAINRDMESLPNMLHPLIKKLLAACMKCGAYSQFDSGGDQIILYSTMTREEIKMYLVWWAYYLMRARKRAQINHFGSAYIKIEHDEIRNDNMGRIHCTLEKVSNSIEDCSSRLFNVVKCLVQAPVSESMFKQTENNTFELSPTAVQEICQEVVYFFLSHTSSNSHIPTESCILCLDNQVGFDS